MPAAPLPEDEASRLAALASYQILDTPTDPSFDRLVQLAAEHFNVPIAIVSLVDADRQWFKAIHGLEAKETPREQAFCAHAILQPDGIFVVEDAEQDQRFKDNPLVTGDPSIRFYAGAPVRAENGQPLGTICIIDRQPRRLTEAEQRFLTNLAGNAGSMLELHRKNFALSAASNTDPLTGLANRRAFNARLEAACTAPASEMSFGLMALDLDRFKQINDELGHEVGDKVLIEVASRLNDVVRGKDLVARMGGDEFVILVAGPIDIQGATTLAQRIMNAFLPDLMYGHRAVPIRTSIGIALAPMHGSDARGLSRAADLALYVSKRGGRQAFTMADSPDAGERRAEVLPSDALRGAIETATVPLRWQPYVRAHSLALAGYEVWPNWGLPGSMAMTAADLRELAEKSGLTEALDGLVLRQACKAAASWPDNLSVSLTLSASWFNKDNLIRTVDQALADSGLPKDRLRIQLSAEIPMLGNDGQAHVASLRECGITAVLTDIGSANAPLAPVSHSGFKGIKLHTRLVHGISDNPRSEAVIAALSGLARGLHMTIHADGVSNSKHLRFLQNAGCDFIQGPLVGQPISSIPGHVIKSDYALIACEEG